jgi:L-fuconolactonase
MRLDSHQHFWRYDPVQYPWMRDDMALLRRDYLPAQLAPLLQSVQFDGSIAVQARQSLAETEWLLALSDQHPAIQGVVGWVDLRSPALAAQLEQFAPHPKLVGVRHVLQDEPEDEFMLLPEFQRGIGQLAKFGLTYDLLLFPRHLPIAVKLVRAFPEQPFVLDHLAKPLIAHGQISPWREDLRELSKLPNVFCKLSGMVTEARWRDWTSEQFEPYLDAAVEAFGTERLMIGSDWPVCTLSAAYSEAMDIVMRYVEQFLAHQRDNILGGTCARFYLQRKAAR